MARGPKKHLKRLAAPHHWMLDKLLGIFAPRPRPGPHKLRESLPLILIIRNRLKYALTAREVGFILKQRFVKVDGKVRTDPKFPTGFMDVITIDKTNDKLRVSLDVKGRAALVKIPVGEEKRKLLRVNKIQYGPNRVPFASCHDGRVIRFPDPLLKKNDTLVYNLHTKQVEDWVRFKVGVLATITGGANTGRVGKITQIERHPGSFDVIHLEDATGNNFATRIANVFVIGRVTPLITLHKSKGIRIPLVKDRELRVLKQHKGGEPVIEATTETEVKPRKAGGKTGKAGKKVKA